MSRYQAGFLAFAAVALGPAVVLDAQVAPGAPRLVVSISVDQLRGDLLDRYADAFDGGFARLRDQGFRYTGANHAHAITHTAAGHATLATGVFPARSGIVANSWAQATPSGWQPMYAVEDPDSPILGYPGVPGRSPRNLLRTTLGDWLSAADPEARVVSISGKDRSAITMGGQGRYHVYWLLAEAGRFVTSTFYRDSYPAWVAQFNEVEMPGILADTVWDSSVPPARRRLARADEGVPFEGDGIHTVFPHVASQETDVGDPASMNAWALGQPRADRAAVGLALRAVDALELGQRDATDHLALAVSATDYVGHGYGPLSQEQLDNLVRLDRELGRLFEYLDAEVGEGRWVAGLSADHGVMTMPEALASEGADGRRVDGGWLSGLIDQALRDAASMVGADTAALADTLALLLERRGLVAEAYTHRALTVGEPADSFAALFRNSHYPGRAGGWLSTRGLEVRFGFAELVSGPRGTSHGSPYWYDRWVPFALLGAGIESGASDRPVLTVDMAPTLAALAGIPIPTDLDGMNVYD